MKQFKNLVELWKAQRVIQVVGFGRTTLWAKTKAGDFPRPVKTGNNSIAWRSDEVLEWIYSRERA